MLVVLGIVATVLFIMGDAVKMLGEEGSWVVVSLTRKTTEIPAL